jgi:hypothetical protein
MFSGLSGGQDESFEAESFEECGAAYEARTQFYMNFNAIARDVSLAKSFSSASPRLLEITNEGEVDGIRVELGIGSASKRLLILLDPHSQNAWLRLKIRSLILKFFEISP